MNMDFRRALWEEARGQGKDAMMGITSIRGGSGAMTEEIDGRQEDRLHDTR